MNGSMFVIVGCRGPGPGIFTPLLENDQKKAGLSAIDIYMVGMVVMKGSEVCLC